MILIIVAFVILSALIFLLFNKWLRGGRWTDSDPRDVEPTDPVVLESVEIGIGEESDDDRVN